MGQTITIQPITHIEGHAAIGITLDDRGNVADKIATPLAQAELEEFRATFGRPAQATLLYHYARLIEEVYACERAIEILQDPEITDPNVRPVVEARAGRGVGCVEAPRGTLIHDYTTLRTGHTTSTAPRVISLFFLITKHTKDTQGGLIIGGVGTVEKPLPAARYGGKVGTDGTYKVYAKGFMRDSFVTPGW